MGKRDERDRKQEPGPHPAIAAASRERYPVPFLCTEGGKGRYPERQRELTGRQQFTGTKWQPFVLPGQKLRASVRRTYRRRLRRPENIGAGSRRPDRFG